jgi:hypothetical protein
MFELIVGQPPFTSIMAKKGDVLQQMVDTIGELPTKWQSSFDTMPKFGQYQFFFLISRVPSKLLKRKTTTYVNNSTDVIRT